MHGDHEYCYLLRPRAVHARPEIFAKDENTLRRTWSRVGCRGAGQSPKRQAINTCLKASTWSDLYIQLLGKPKHTARWKSS